MAKVARAEESAWQRYERTREEMCGKTCGEGARGSEEPAAGRDLTAAAPVVGGVGRDVTVVPCQLLLCSFHSAWALFSSSAILSRKAFAVVLPSSTFWNSGSLSALLMVFQSGR